MKAQQFKNEISKSEKFEKKKMINVEEALEFIIKNQELNSKLEEALKKNFSNANLVFWKELHELLEKSKIIEKYEIEDQIEVSIPILYDKFLTDTSMDEISLSLNVKSKWIKAIEAMEKKETDREENLLNLLQQAKKEVERIMLIDVSNFIREKNVVISNKTATTKEEIKISEIYVRNAMLFTPSTPTNQTPNVANKKFLCKIQKFFLYFQKKIFKIISTNFFLISQSRKFFGIL